MQTGVSTEGSLAQEKKVALGRILNALAIIAGLCGVGSFLYYWDTGRTVIKRLQASTPYKYEEVDPKHLQTDPETLIHVRSAEAVKRAVQHLDNLKDPKDILKTCVEINRLENEADHVLRAAMAKLFREEQDVRQLIKLKEIYELLETVTDRCEDVANVIEGIVLEYA